MVFNKVFENIISLNDNKSTSSSPTFVNPGVFPKPNLSKYRLDFIHTVGQTIEKQPDDQRRRIELSLQWFESAIRSMGRDEFLKLWIALETLGMDNTNIKPLNRYLSNIYKMPINKVATSFGLGRIFGLRSKVVHEGKDKPIHHQLTEYLEAVYVDILLEVLNIESLQRAKIILSKPGFSLDKLV